MLEYFNTECDLGCRRPCVIGWLPDWSETSHPPSSRGHSERLGNSNSMRLDIKSLGFRTLFYNDDHEFGKLSPIIQREP